MACLFKRANGIYSVRYVDLSGKTVWRSTGKRTERAAEKRAAEILKEAGKKAPRAYEAEPGLTVKDALARYVAWAEGYYVPGGQVDRIRTVVRCAEELFGADLAGEFGPRKLGAVQQALIGRGHCRTNINALVNRLRHGFRWLASQEYIPAPVALALTTVSGLRAGKSKAKEKDAVKPVAVDVVEATLRHIQGPVAAMVRLQLATGARPGEIVRLRPCDVDRSKEVWEVSLAEHKTAHRGKTRTVLVGPRGQEALRPYLLRDEQAWCFSPREAVEAQAAAAKGHRRDGQWVTRRKTARTIGDCYDVAGYRRAIVHGIAAHNRWAKEHGEKAIGHWHPNQLRHTAATELRRMFGLEAAQVVLGHAQADVTQIYAEVDLEKARAAVLQYG